MEEDAREDGAKEEDGSEESAKRQLYTGVNEVKETVVAELTVL